ncbi:helix-turn-helix domain-containing protein [Bradyrhizobium sp. WYCCWR 13022]|uniref:helix-turn-helix domain-containing protein n=1 Tax=unclassified Bradyrhizobium TaxID=2631580 RepID=UPI00263B7D74|nr:helix-turn-helix domain-containing protein [Bradyrhizobium sp. WYCCWR 13022]MDN4988475.1 helix-turn-helix domain-containing protein [Bradyrhizobium sp. WYCCWR 13022]
MDIKRALPHPLYRGVVRSLEERRVELGSAVLSWPVAARPHQILNIHLAEPYRVRIDDGGASKTPDMSVVGPQTYRRAHVSLSGSIHVFNILFQPTGLNRLLGINMTSLVNQDPAASDVLGASAATLGDAVRAAPSFDLRVAAVEHWLTMMLERRGPDDFIGFASRKMIAVQGRVRIENLVAKSGLSTSQFQRRFATQVGLTPKLFARTIRFDQALLAHRKNPRRSWTDIIHELGYFDQAQFIRECHGFAGLPPGSLVGDWENTFSPGE